MSENMPSHSFVARYPNYVQDASSTCVCGEIRDSAIHNEDARVKDGLPRTIWLRITSTEPVVGFNPIFNPALVIDSDVPYSRDYERLRWLLERIIADLPKRRDWLDPDIEAEARAVTGVQLVQPAASPPTKCVKCGHRATIDGRCQVGVGEPDAVTGYKPFCGCNCEFAAASAEAQERKRNDGV